MNKIDFLIVIYKNYDLLHLQIDTFKKLFLPEEYRLIFIDNTPDQEVSIIDKTTLPENCFVYKNTSPDHSHDGASAGSALNFGRQYCTSDIVCVMDSDFFITNRNIINIVNKELQSYKAIGTEYYDGEPDFVQSWVQIRKEYEHKFTNIPCCFCMFMHKDILNADSWIVTAKESSHNRRESFIETGWRIRKYILDNNIPTKTWLGYQPLEAQGTELPTYFKTEQDELIGFHYQRGSHRRSNLTDIEIPELLKIYLVKLI